MSQDIDMLKVMEQVQKLLDKAADRSVTPAEKEAFQGKAEAIMLRHNLNAAMVEASTGVKSGKREELKLRGGFYNWQRDLWKAVAELNFCLYWTQTYWAPNHSHLIKAGRPLERRQKRHRLVGRIINTTATKVTTVYLEEAIERVLRETLHITNQQQFSNEAVSFRKGCAEELILKIGMRYRERVSAEKRKATVARAAANAAEAMGHSTSTALTISSYKQAEEDANMDFVKGEGYSARKRAQEAEWAAEERAAEVEYTRWAKAHPEEARAKQEAEDEEDRKYWAKRSRLGSGSGPRDRTDRSMYLRGREAGQKISIEPQMASTAGRMIGKGK